MILTRRAMLRLLAAGVILPGIVTCELEALPPAQAAPLSAPAARTLTPTGVIPPGSGTTLFWRARAVTKHGGISNWTTTRAFTVGKPSPPPPPPHRRR